MLNKINISGIKISALTFSTSTLILILFSLSLYSLWVTDQKKNKINYIYSEEIMDLDRMLDATEKQISASWGYLLFKEERMLQNLALAKKDFHLYFNQLSEEVTTKEGRKFLHKIRKDNQEYLEFFYTHSAKASNIKSFQDELLRRRDLLTNTLTDFRDFKRNRLKNLRVNSLSDSRQSWQIAIVLGAAGAILVPLLAFIFMKLFQRQYEVLQKLSFKEEWLQGMSHDLKNPIGTILLSTSMLDRKTGHGELSRYISKIKISCQNMLDLIADSISLTQIESGKLLLTKDNHLASQLIDECIENMNLLAQEKGIIIKKEMIENFQVLCDRTKILRVLNNLASNAIKFSSNNKDIILSAKTENNQAIFSVKDCGTGIEEEDLPHLFEKFWQSERDAHKGSGLGLAISKGIIKAHQGRIWVESKIGKGSIFYFSIPM